MKPFFNLKTLDQVHALLAGVGPLEAEETELAQAAGRTLAAPLAAPCDLPGFLRATMDGFAVRGRDTFGATESEPGYLELAGEVAMGRAPEFSLGRGQCARIGTGGMLPAGADAVVMVEHTRSAGAGSVEITRAVAPGGHTLGPTDDAAAGQEILPAGHLLRPQDVGLMAALGLERAMVVRRPRVGIVSTGDEVVPVASTPGPGQVRDVNTHTLAAQVSAAGGEPVLIGLVGDERSELSGAVERSLAGCDLTLLSGGSSMGARDLTAEVFMSFAGAELLVHGAAVSPGKPFIWVAAGGRHLLGLPGQVASCMIAFYLFAEPLMERLLGRDGKALTRFAPVPARLARNLPSAPGREEYVRVRLARREDGLVAEPLFGKSGLLCTLVEGHGLLRVGRDSEGLDAGTWVTVHLFPGEAMP